MTTLPILPVEGRPFRKAILTKNGSEVHFFWKEDSENVVVVRWSGVSKHESTRQLNVFLARLLWRSLLADGYKIEVLV